MAPFWAVVLCGVMAGLTSGLAISLFPHPVGWVLGYFALAMIRDFHVDEWELLDE